MSMFRPALVKLLTASATMADAVASPGMRMPVFCLKAARIPGKQMSAMMSRRTAEKRPLRTKSTAMTNHAVAASTQIADATVASSMSACSLVGALVSMLWL